MSADLLALLVYCAVLDEGGDLDLELVDGLGIFRPINLSEVRWRIWDLCMPAFRAATWPRNV